MNFALDFSSAQGDGAWRSEWVGAGEDPWPPVDAGYMHTEAALESGPFAELPYLPDWDTTGVWGAQLPQEPQGWDVYAEPSAQTPPLSFEPLYAQALPQYEPPADSQYMPHDPYLLSNTAFGPIPDAIDTLVPNLDISMHTPASPTLPPPPVIVPSQRAQTPTPLGSFDIPLLCASPGRIDSRSEADDVSAGSPQKGSKTSLKGKYTRARHASTGSSSSSRRPPIDIACLECRSRHKRCVRLAGADSCEACASPQKGEAKDCVIPKVTYRGQRSRPQFTMPSRIRRGPTK